MKRTHLKSKLKNSFKRMLKSTFVMRCLSVLIYFYALFAGKTTKWEICGLDDLVKNVKDTNAIIVGWHSRTTMLPFFWSKYVKKKLSALVSPHQDGQIIANFLRWFKIKSVNGSTNENPRQSALEMMREVLNGSNLFISPDGPRGPRMRMKKSPIYFAQKSGKPIYCVCFTTNKALIFEKAWDRTMIILPFGKGIFCVSEPIYVPKDINDEEFEQYRKKLEDIAIKQLIDCDIKVGRVPCYPADINDYKRKVIK